MFILLSSEKNEPRSAAAVIGLCRSAAGAALGGCGTRCAQTLFALILGWLASSRPDKGGGTLYASFWSFRATTRYPEISGLAFYPVSFSAYTFYRAAGPRIGVRGDGFVSYRAATWRLSHSAQRRGIQGIPGRCSFFSAARRTNQEAPPLLSGFVARRLVPPSGAAELAVLRHSSPLSSAGWPPPGPIKEEERCTRRFGHSALRCGIQAKKIRDMVLKIQQAGRGDKKTPPRRSGEAGVVQCAWRVPRVGVICSR